MTQVRLQVYTQQTKSSQKTEGREKEKEKGIHSQVVMIFTPSGFVYLLPVFGSLANI